KSHMSSLDKETEERIRKNFFGKKPDAVEVTRVRPTVIRRRKKVASGEPVKPEVDKAASEPAAEAPVAEPTVKAPVAEPAEPVVQETSKAPAKKQAASPAEDAARIIAMKKTPAETAPEAESADQAAQKAGPEDDAGQPPEPADQVAPATEPAGQAVPTVEPGTLVDLNKEPADEVVPEKEVKPPVEEPVAKPAKPARQVRKKKKESAARIIKPAPAVSTVTRQPAVAPQSTRSKPVQGDPRKTISHPPLVKTVGKDTDKKKKGWKKKPVETVEDKKFFKKKISFRRKAVVEGSDLYNGKGRGRKGRKGYKGAKGKGAQQFEKTVITTPKAIKRRIKIDETIVLSELAKRMGIKASEMIIKLMSMGVMATVNQTIDFDTAVLVAAEFDYEVEKASFEEDILLKPEEDNPENLSERPPVVTIMGHVDHGKTSLLDVIRKTRVTEFEAGGITQHIGAYQVETDRGQIVFLDTPGHKAFTAMRARGAQVTDIVVLVVAADDGVMPQTIEAISHSKASNVPIIVAVNKIDKNNADPERVLRELADVGLMSEEWGGDTIFVKVSAKQNTGVDELLEMIQLQAELMELKADPGKHAVGHVVEARLDSGRGPVATVLIKEGTLYSGDPVVCGVHYGKIRAMLNDRGDAVDAAGPSMPVEIIGLTGVPTAGDELIALADDKSAKQVSEHRIQKQRSLDLAKNSRLSLEGLFEKMQEGEVKELNLIIKADVDGSIEALRDSLVKLSNKEVSINVIHSATGTITESDVSLATVSDAIIIGFNVRPNSKVTDMAAEENVDIRYHSIIYDVIREIKDAILGMMSSTYEEKILGRAEVREIFHVPKIGTIAGSSVIDGKIERDQQVRLIREGIVLYEGRISSLRRFKDDVREVQSGYECGIGIEKYNDIKLGDIIECYLMKEIKPEMA
ncbi:MAG: translation initiation factor IF-2, partial [Deltaproteobacteria bacterium]